MLHTSASRSFAWHEGVIGAYKTMRSQLSLMSTYVKIAVATALLAGATMIAVAPPEHGPYITWVQFASFRSNRIHCQRLTQNLRGNFRLTYSHPAIWAPLSCEHNTREQIGVLYVG
jgi:hypothetical protein